LKTASMATSTRKASVRFKERAELLDFLLEVAAATSETLDLDRLLPVFADSIARVIPHDLFAILLYNEKIQGLRVRYARGHRDEVVKNVVLQLGEGLTGVAAATRQTILVPDVRLDPRYISTVDAVRAELSVPMVARGKLVGIIDLQSTRENAFSEQDAALLRLLAARAPRDTLPRSIRAVAAEHGTGLESLTCGADLYGPRTTAGRIRIYVLLSRRTRGVSDRLSERLDRRCRSFLDVGARLRVRLLHLSAVARQSSAAGARGSRGQCLGGPAFQPGYPG